MPGTYGGQSMIAPLRRVIVRRPTAAFGAADPEQWHYTARPDLAAAQAEHDALTAIVRASGAEVIEHDEDLPEHADSIFVFDPALITDRGAVLLRMGKELRRGEEHAQGRLFARLGVPVLGALHGDACAESGDMFWLDPQTLVVGIGFRTNAAGVAQLRALLAPGGVSVVTYDLPYFTGPAACLHLLSLISLVDQRLAVVYLPLLPVALWQTLVDRGFTLIDVPEPEFMQTMATNVLAVGPGQCVMLRGNPVTKAALEAHGCEVQAYRGDEISLKAEGGATCLTRPLLRG
jgi:dimethylargininase